MRRSFRPHWQMLLPVFALGVSALLIVVVAVQALDGTPATLVVLASISVWSLLSIRRLLDWLTTGYTVTNERVIYRAGVLARRGIEIPLESITNVSFSQSFFERLIRSGDVLIESAGEQGQSRYTDIPDPEALQSVIYQLREVRIVHLRGAGRSAAEELAAMADLRDRGVISEAEFQDQKRRLLAGGENGEGSGR
ncbi:MAG TPA: PH domain-containing protein [Acidimicrobiia bacterium]